MRRRLRVFLVTGTTLLPAAAFAQQAGATQPPSSCPPGSWFCAEANANTQGAPTASAAAQPPPPIVVESTPAPVPPAAPPVVVEPPPQATYVYAKAAPRWRPEWGLTGRLSSGGGGGSSMGGFGVGGRYRPNPYGAVEINLDGFGGRDSSDRFRTEGAFTVNGLLFFNPRSRWQWYGLAGLGWASASVGESPNYDSRFALDRYNMPGGNFSYFGAQMGFGLEYRFSPHWAVHSDFRGFLRRRTDSRSDGTPEFVQSDLLSPTHYRSTNSSGGGLWTIGITAYMF